MSLTSQANGTLTLDGTEQRLNSAAFTTAGVYVLMLDLSDMGKADELEVRAYVKCLSAGSELLTFCKPFRNDQGDAATQGSSAKGAVMRHTYPIPSLYSISWTVKRTANGTAAFDSLPWNVMTL